MSRKEKMCSHCGEITIVGDAFCFTCGANLQTDIRKPVRYESPKPTRREYVPFEMDDSEPNVKIIFEQPINATPHEIQKMAYGTRKVNGYARRASTSNTDVMGVISIIFSIVAIMLYIVPFIGFYFAIFSNVVAFITGLIGVVEKPNNRATSIIGLSLSLIAPCLFFLGLFSYFYFW